MTTMMLIRELDRLYLAAQRSGDPADWDAYVIAKRALDRMIFGGREIRPVAAPKRADAELFVEIPNAPRNGSISRLRAFLRALAIRFRSRVGLPLAGSGS